MKYSSSDWIFGMAFFIFFTPLKRRFFWKKLLLFFSIIFSSFFFSCQHIIPESLFCTCNNDSFVYEWVVIGAGVGGIVAIGKLIDMGFNLKSIAWVDQHFSVGRLGEFYGLVPANVMNGKFYTILNNQKSFRDVHSNALNHLGSLPKNDFSPLNEVIAPLQEITNDFMQRVNAFKGTVVSMHFYGNRWHIFFDNGDCIIAKSVILATGSKPRELEYPASTVIPLDYALNKNLLKELVKPDDTVAVVGGSHSAILVLMFLNELPVKKIINFYLSPIVYAFDEEGNRDNPMGIKGIAAQWARKYLNGENNAPKILRIFNSANNREKYLSSCDKIIYAVGFIPRHIPTISINNEEFDESQLSFDPQSGTIGPRLFGIGIAFPDFTIEGPGIMIYKIGIEDFIEYINERMAFWCRCHEMLSEDMPNSSIKKIADRCVVM